MDIKLKYEYAGAVLKQVETELCSAHGDCFETDFGTATIILDAPQDGVRVPEFVSVFRLAGPIGQLSTEARHCLGRMIDHDLVHVLEVRQSSWVDEQLLAFCKTHDIGFIGSMIQCEGMPKDAEKTDLATRFFEPFDDIHSFIRNIKEGNFLVESRAQIYCSSDCANALLKPGISLEANPLFGQKSENAYMLRLKNSSPFSVLMRFAGEERTDNKQSAFVLHPNGRHLINVDDATETLSSDEPEGWKFEWLNVRQFDGAQVTASLRAASA